MDPAVADGTFSRGLYDVLRLTPLSIPPGLRIAIGDPVFFRHAKAGELAEHFAEYILVRGERVEARASTYRGLHKCFLG